MTKTRIYIALFLTYMLFAVLLNSVGTVILQSIQYYNVSKPDASILEGFKDIPIAIVSFLIASSLPQFGYKKALVIALSAVGLACIAMPLIDQFWATKLLFFICGCAFAATKISVYSSIGLLTDTPQKHASSLSILEGFFMVGVLSGYWIFSIFIIPDNAASSDWLNVYWFLAATSFAIISLLLMFPLDEREARKTEEPLNRVAEFKQMFTLLLIPFVFTFLIAAFIYVLVEQSIGTWLPTFNNDVFNLPTRMSVQMASIYAVALAIGRFGAGGVLRFLSWQILLTICLICTAALIALSLPLAENVDQTAQYSWTNAPLGAYIFPLIGLFMAPIYPVLNSIILSALPKYRHAAMTGLLVIFSALGGTSGSLVIGWLYEKYSGPQAFYLVIIPIFLLLILVWVIYYIQRKTPSLEQPVEC